MGVSRLLEFYWQALLPSGNRLEKTLPRLYQTGEGSSKHSDSVIGSGSGIDARVAFWLATFCESNVHQDGVRAHAYYRHYMNIRIASTSMVSLQNLMIIA